MTDKQMNKAIEMNDGDDRTNEYGAWVEKKGVTFKEIAKYFRKIWKVA